MFIACRYGAICFEMENVSWLMFLISCLSRYSDCSICSYIALDNVVYGGLLFNVRNELRHNRRLLLWQKFWCYSYTVEIHVQPLDAKVRYKQNA